MKLRPAKLAYLKKTIAGAVVLFLCGVSYPEAADANWTWRNPLPQGNHLNRVVWADDRFIAVGDYGTVVTSWDGEEWAVHPPPVPQTLHGLMWTGTEAIAVGAEGVLLRSADGVSWDVGSAVPEKVDPESIVLRGISRTEDGVYLAVGNLGGSALIVLSTDGEAWTIVEEFATYASARFHDVVWSGERFVAVGQVYNNLHEYPIIRTSPDGAEWGAGQYGGVGGMTSVTWTGEEFVAAGWARFNWRYAPPPECVLISSADGIEWTKRYQTTIPLNGADWVDGKLIASGSNFAGVVTMEGEEWEVEDPEFPLARTLRSVAGNNRAMVAVGERIGHSEGGDDWRLITRGTTRSAGLLVPVGNGWIARSPGGYLFSPDAVNWFERRLPSSLGWWWQPVWSGDEIYAVGNQRVAVSSDGESWEMKSAPPFEVTAAAWAEDRLWVGGETDGHTALATTLDGEEWSFVELPEWEGEPRSIIWTGQQLLIVGVKIVDRGQGPVFVLHTEDFQEWEREWLIADEVSFRTAAWNGVELRVIVERTRWQPLSIGWSWGSEAKVSPVEGLAAGIAHVLWSGDRWLGVGSFGVWTATQGIRYHGVIGSSFDGVEWKLDRRTSRSLHAISHADGLTIVGGAEGQILTLGEVDEVPTAITQNPSSPRALAGSYQDVDFFAEFMGNPPPIVEWQESTDGGQTWSKAHAVPTIAPAQLRVVADETVERNFRAVVHGWDEPGEPVMLFSDPAAIEYLSAGEVVGSPELDIQVDGPGLWRIEEQAFHSGDASIRGFVLDAEKATLTTYVEGPGRFTFCWQRYSTRNHFAFSRNGYPLVTGAAREWQEEKIYLGPGTHELTWTLGGDAGIDGVTLDTFSFESGKLPESDYDRWAALTIGEAGTLRSGPFSDFNNDGVSNLENYAFGLDHLDSGDRQGITLARESGEEGDFVTVEAPLRRDPDLLYLLEISGDLAEWEKIQLRYFAENNSWEVDPERESLQISHEPVDYSVFTLSLPPEGRKFVRFRLELEEEE